MQEGGEQIKQEADIVGHLKFGKVYNGFFLGLSVMRHEEVTEITTNDASTRSQIQKTKSIRSGSGVSIGYLAKNGLALTASYLFLDAGIKDPERHYMAKSSQVYDLAYLIKFSSLSLGPQLTMTTTRFQSANGEKLTGTWKNQDFKPFVGLWVDF